MSSIDNKVYSPVWKCIYCGATESLGKEHILPFGLSGTAILPKASCQICAKITGDIEQKLLRGEFWPVRIYRDLKSRTKYKNAPQSFELNVVVNGEMQSHRLASDEYPILLHLPILGLPGYLQGKAKTSGLPVSGIATIRFGVDLEKTVRSLGSKEVQITSTTHPSHFARMIAKIAFAFACAEGALKDIEGKSFVLPAILGEKDDIGHWVGMSLAPTTSDPNFLHRIELKRDRERQLLLAQVRLFADSETPTYCVVLGRLLH